MVSIAVTPRNGSPLHTDRAVLKAMTVSTVLVPEPMHVYNQHSHSHQQQRQQKIESLTTTPLPEKPETGL